MKKNAVLYLRSSKDRHDVSIESQRHELGKLAAELGLAIAGEFRDVVESGKDDDRPGLQALLGQVRRRDRGWSSILLLDTSRLARRLVTAIKFESECQVNGVDVVYKSLPKFEEAERALIKTVLHGVDEWHSLVSKRKGLAGMRQNVKSGFRAGGRAPFGYRLDYVDLGIVREGRPVLKSRLVIGPESLTIGRYLKDRAAGAARRPLRERLGLELNESSLIGIEWNALTYAGHTVWNVHAERAGGGYIGGAKRRPRSDWVIQRDTHEALITDAEAEAILHRLEQASVKAPRRTSANYLLSGLLRTSDGHAWYGDRHRYYRVGNQHVARQDVDQAILGKVAGDLRSKAFSEALVRRVRTSYGRGFTAELERLTVAEAELDGRISRFMGMAEKLDSPEPVLRKVAEIERDRKRIAKEIERATRDARMAAEARRIDGDQVGRLLDALAGDMARFEPEKLKDFLHAICERITLNPQTLSARIHYKIPLARRDKLASPRAAEGIPHAEIVSYVRVPRKAA